MDVHIKNKQDRSPVVKVTICLGSEKHAIESRDGIIPDQLPFVKVESILKECITKHNDPNDVPDDAEVLSEYDDGEIELPVVKSKKIRKKQLISNFATLDETTSVVSSRRADRHFEEEGPILCAALDKMKQPSFLEYEVTVKIHFRYATEHICGVVVKGPKLKEAKHTETIVNELSKEISKFLIAHPLNAKRAAEGKNIANIVLIRGYGIKIEVPVFEENHVLRPCMVAPTKIIAGLGLSLVMLRDKVGWLNEEENRADTLSMGEREERREGEVRERWGGRRERGRTRVIREERSKRVERQEISEGEEERERDEREEEEWREGRGGEGLELRRGSLSGEEEKERKDKKFMKTRKERKEWERERKREEDSGERGDERERAEVRQRKRGDLRERERVDERKKGGSRGQVFREKEERRKSCKEEEGSERRIEKVKIVGGDGGREKQEGEERGRERKMMRRKRSDGFSERVEKSRKGFKIDEKNTEKKRVKKELKELREENDCEEMMLRERRERLIRGGERRREVRDDDGEERMKEFEKRKDVRGEKDGEKEEKESISEKRDKVE
ncbi:putative 2,3-bisphosphoglycerate-independent phosphoglycerate mutase [Tanacetum coccineum]